VFNKHTLQHHDRGSALESKLLVERSAYNIRLKDGSGNSADYSGRSTDGSGKSTGNKKSSEDSEKSTDNITSAEGSSTVVTSEIRPTHCPIGPSCRERRHPQLSPTGTVQYPCYCDAQCHLYSDCCHDVYTPPLSATPSSLNSSYFTCRSLNPRSYYMMYMVTRCPEGTENNLAAKCNHTAPPSYLMDIPVFSSSSGIAYRNIFCAKCHRDFSVQRYNFSLSCSMNLTSTTQLENMTYHPGQLKWTLPDKIIDEGEAGVERRFAPVFSNTLHSMSCWLNVPYPSTMDRWCIEHVID
ncbi:hypothetical protein OTU49_016607, partial [Cherax quadricarinatus]